MAQIRREARPLPDGEEFRRTAALAILFHCTEKLYGELGYTGYRANVVTYVVARLSQMLQSRLPYEEIWETQSVPSGLIQVLKTLTVGVREVLVDRRPPNTNITEWCKKDQCWSAVLQREFDVNLPDASGWKSEGGGHAGTNSEDSILVRAAKLIPAEVWFGIAKWAKETQTLYPSQRAIAFSIGQVVSRGASPSLKQAQSALKLLNRARQLGFTHSSLSTEHIELINAAAANT
jgi:hypothetical protein